MDARGLPSIVSKDKTVAVIRYGDTAGRLWTTVSTAPISRPIISNFLNPLKSIWLASDLQQMPTWINLQTRKIDFFCAGIKALVKVWGRCLNASGAYVKVWCVPSATHVSCTHRSPTVVLDIRVALYFETAVYIILYPLIPRFFLTPFALHLVEYIMNKTTSGKCVWIGAAWRIVTYPRGGNREWGLEWIRRNTWQVHQWLIVWKYGDIIACRNL